MQYLPYFVPFPASDENTLESAFHDYTKKIWKDYLFSRYSDALSDCKEILEIPFHDLESSELGNEDHFFRWILIRLQQPDGLKFQNQSLKSFEIPPPWYDEYMEENGNSCGVAYRYYVLPYAEVYYEGNFLSTEKPLDIITQKFTTLAAAEDYLLNLEENIAHAVQVELKTEIILTDYDPYVFPLENQKYMRIDPSNPNRTVWFWLVGGQFLS